MSDSGHCHLLHPHCALVRTASDLCRGCPLCPEVHSLPLCLLLHPRASFKTQASCASPRDPAQAESGAPSGARSAPTLTLLGAQCRRPRTGPRVSQPSTLALPLGSFINLGKFLNVSVTQVAATVTKPFEDKMRRCGSKA